MVFVAGGRVNRYFCDCGATIYMQHDQRVTVVAADPPGQRRRLCWYPQKVHEAEITVKFVPERTGQGWPGGVKALWLCPFHYELACQRWGRKQPEDRKEVCR